MTAIVAFHPPDRQVRRRPRRAKAEIINIEAAWTVDPDAVKKVAATLARLPNPRDLEAAIKSEITNFRRDIVRRFGTEGAALAGAVRVAELTLRKEIKTMRSAKP